jgi:hypothetical protein
LKRRYGLPLTRRHISEENKSQIGVCYQRTYKDSENIYGSPWFILCLNTDGDSTWITAPKWYKTLRRVYDFKVWSRMKHFFLIQADSLTAPQFKHNVSCTKATELVKTQENSVWYTQSLDVLHNVLAFIQCKQKATFLMAVKGRDTAVLTLESWISLNRMTVSQLLEKFFKFLEVEVALLNSDGLATDMRTSQIYSINIHAHHTIRIVFTLFVLYRRIFSRKISSFLMPATFSFQVIFFHLISLEQLKKFTYLLAPHCENFFSLFLLPLP